MHLDMIHTSMWGYSNRIGAATTAALCGILGDKVVCILCISRPHLHLLFRYQKSWSQCILESDASLKVLQ